MEECATVNDRGVALDIALVRNAIRADAFQLRVEPLDEELTDLDNPNSVTNETVARR